MKMLQRSTNEITTFFHKSFLLKRIKCDALQTGRDARRIWWWQRREGSSLLLRLGVGSVASTSGRGGGPTGSSASLTVILGNHSSLDTRALEAANRRHTCPDQQEAVICTCLSRGLARRMLCQVVGDAPETDSIDASTTSTLPTHFCSNEACEVGKEGLIVPDK